MASTKKHTYPKAPQITTPLPKAPKYSIAEWYGKRIDALTDSERLAYAVAARKKAAVADVPCPYRTTFFGKPMPCNKAGGVCTIAQYTTNQDEVVTVGADSACVCPVRLLDPAVFKHIGKAVLNSDQTWVVREIPFLQNAVQNEKGKNAKAGRIDFVLVDDKDRENWCAVETQAVYFSGDNMGIEFDAIAAANGKLLLPIGQRRPDYRSSVPKRLSPQLMLKAPHLGRGKQIAVVVDQFVKGQMAELLEPHVNSEGMEAEELRLEKLALSEIVWFFVNLPGGKAPAIASEMYATLKDSIRALDSALPIPAVRFSKSMGTLIDDIKQHGKKALKLF